jgi:hypothetical protein
METEMKKVLILLALMMFIGMPVLAQDKPKEEPKKEAAETVDAWALYKKKGRTWTWKIASKYSGYESVMYSKYEVLEVTDTKATVKVSSMDKDKKDRRQDRRHRQGSRNDRREDQGRGGRV